MNTRAVRAFLPDLREIERQLTVPIPERVRILQELEYDLEELRDRFVAQGLSTVEARTRALEALAPDARALRDLARLHEPLYRRLTGRVSSERLRVAERSALVVATTSVVLVQALALLRADLLRDPSPFLWPVLGLGAALFAAIAAKAFELWIKGDHSEPRRGLGGILFLSGATLVVGIGGVAVDLYRLFGILESAPELASAIVPLWLMRECALLSVAILLALMGALTWFVLTQWLSVTSFARRDALGLGRIRPSH